MEHGNDTVPSNSNESQQYGDGINDVDVSPQSGFRNTERSRTMEVSLSYKCPICGGMFRYFDNDGVGGPKRCPFCHVEAGEFGEDDTDDGGEKTESIEEENDRLREELQRAEDRIDQLTEALEEVEEMME